MWEKYWRAGQATDNNMAHAHCMLDNQGYRHTLRISDTYCFSTTTTVTRTRFNDVFIGTLPLLCCHFYRETKNDRKNSIYLSLRCESSWHLLLCARHSDRCGQGDASIIANSWQREGIIIIIIFINCNWVDTRWQWLFYMYTKYDIDYY
jgi:hypothetical protein